MSTFVLLLIFAVLVYSVITNERTLARNFRYVQFMVMLHRAQLTSPHGINDSDRAYLLDLLDEVM